MLRYAFRPRATTHSFLVSFLSKTHASYQWEEWRRADGASLSCATSNGECDSNAHIDSNADSVWGKKSCRARCTIRSRWHNPNGQFSSALS